MRSSIQETITASEHRNELLFVPVLLWIRMVWAVRKRGLGHRESGAFFLGTRKNGRAKAVKFLLYDDLDPHALMNGIIMFHAAGFKALWKRCRELALEVVADVHTHGDDHPKQSTVDKEHPLISEPGHIAMILPCFAQRWGIGFRDVAICEYIGNYQWKVWTGKQRRERVRFSWW